MRYRLFAAFLTATLPASAFATAIPAGTTFHAGDGYTVVTDTPTSAAGMVSDTQAIYGFANGFLSYTAESPVLRSISDTVRVTLVADPGRLIDSVWAGNGIDVHPGYYQWGCASITYGFPGAQVQGGASDGISTCGGGSGDVPYFGLNAQTLWPAPTGLDLPMVTMTVTDWTELFTSSGYVQFGPIEIDAWTVAGSNPGTTTSLSVPEAAAATTFLVALAGLIGLAGSAERRRGTRRR